MLSPLFLLLFALVLPASFATDNRFQCSRYCKRTNRFAYEVGKVYQYKYEGAAKSFLNGTSDSEARLKFSAYANIRVLSGCDFALELENVSHEEATQNEARVQLYPTDTAKTFGPALTANSLYFSFQNGKVETVCPANEEPTWVLNVKKAILSIFQNGMVNFNENAVIYENDISGNCETFYSVSEDKTSNIVSINKTKNLNSCTQRASSYANIHSTPYLKRNNKMSQPILRSTQSCSQTFEINYSTKGVMLLSANCNERHAFKPFSNGDGGAVTISQQYFRFVKEIYQEFHARGTFTNTRKNLLYEKTKTLIDSDAKDVNNDIQKIFGKLGAKGSKVDAPFLFSELVGKLRQLPAKSLIELFANTPKEHKRFLVDAMPLVGTAESVSVISDLHRRQWLTKSQIEAWITSLALISEPSIDIIAAFNNLFDEPDLFSSPKSAVLSLSSLIHQHCALDQKCSKKLDIHKSLAIIEKPFKTSCVPSSPSEHEAILLALKAVGNAGITTALVYLESCYKNANAPLELRLAAVAAHRRVPCHRNANYNSLQDVFADGNNGVELRIGAYLTVTQCMSYSAFLRIKEVLFRESTNQVGSFVWTHITNLQETSSKWKQSVRGIVENDFLRNKFNTDARKYSRNYEFSAFFDSIDAGATVDSNVVFTPESFLPRSASLNLTLDLFGETVNVFEVGGRIEGFEGVVENFFGPDGHFPDASLSSAVKSLRGGAAAGGTLGKEPRGLLYAKVFGNELSYGRFSSVDDLIGAPVNRRSVFGDCVNSFLKNDVDYAKSFEFLDSSHTVPTVLGFPLTLTVRGSATVSLTAKSKFDVSGDKIDVGGRFYPSAAVRIEGNMHVDSSLSKIGLSLVTTMNSDTYFDGSLSIERGKFTDLRINVPKEQTDVIKVQSQLYVVRNADRKEILGIKDNAESYDSCSGRTFSDVTGMKFCTSLRYANASQHPDAPYFPLTGPFRYSVAFEKTDRFDEYVFKFVNQARELEVYVDTPKSAVNRRLQLNFVSNGKDECNVKFSSPFANATADLLVDLQRWKLQLNTTVNDRAALYLDSYLISLHSNGAKNAAELYFRLAYFQKLLAKVTGNLDASEKGKYKTNLQISSFYLDQAPLSLSGQLVTTENRRSFEAELSSKLLNGNVHVAYATSREAFEAELESSYTYQGNAHNLRSKLEAVLGANKLGRFSLVSSQKPNFNTLLVVTQDSNSVEFDMTFNRIQYGLKYQYQNVAKDAYVNRIFLLSLACPSKNIEYTINLSQLFDSRRFRVNALAQLNAKQRLQAKVDVDMGDLNNGLGTRKADVLVYYPGQEWTAYGTVAHYRSEEFSVEFKAFRQKDDAKKETLVVMTPHLTFFGGVSHAFSANVDFPQNREPLKAPWVVEWKLYAAQGDIEYLATINVHNDTKLEVLVKKNATKFEGRVVANDKTLIVVETTNERRLKAFLASVNIYQHFEVSAKYLDDYNFGRVRFTLYWHKERDQKLAFWGDLNLSSEVNLGLEYPGQKIGGHVRIGNEHFLTANCTWGLAEPQFASVKVDQLEGEFSFAILFESSVKDLERVQMQWEMLASADTLDAHALASWLDNEVQITLSHLYVENRIATAFKVSSTFQKLRHFYVKFSAAQSSPSVSHDVANVLAAFELNSYKTALLFNSTRTPNDLKLYLDVNSPSRGFKSLTGALTVAENALNGLVSCDGKTVSVKYKFERYVSYIEILTPFPGLQENLLSYHFSRKPNKFDFDAKAYLFKQKNSVKFLWSYENRVGVAQGAISTSKFGAYKLSWSHSNGDRFAEHLSVEKDDREIFAVQMQGKGSFISREPLFLDGHLGVLDNFANFSFNGTADFATCDLEGKWAGERFSSKYKRTLSLPLSRHKAGVVFWNVKSTRFDRDFDLIFRHVSGDDDIAFKLILPNGYSLTNTLGVGGRRLDNKLRIVTPSKSGSLNFYLVEKIYSLEFFASCKVDESEGSLKLFYSVFEQAALPDKFDLNVDVPYKKQSLDIGYDAGRKTETLWEPTFSVAAAKKEVLKVVSTLTFDTPRARAGSWTFNVTTSDNFHGDVKFDVSGVNVTVIKDLDAYELTSHSNSKYNSLKVATKFAKADDFNLNLVYDWREQPQTLKFATDYKDNKFSLDFSKSGNSETLEKRITVLSTFKDWEKLSLGVFINSANKTGSVEISRNDKPITVSYVIVNPNESSLEAKLDLRSSYPGISDAHFYCKKELQQSFKSVALDAGCGSYKGELSVGYRIEKISSDAISKLAFSSNCKLAYSGDGFRPFSFESQLASAAVIQQTEAGETAKISLIYKSNLPSLNLVKALAKYRVKNIADHSAELSFVQNNSTYSVSEVTSHESETHSNELVVETPKELFGRASLKSDVDFNGNGFDLTSKLDTPSERHKFEVTYSIDVDEMLRKLTIRHFGQNDLLAHDFTVECKLKSLQAVTLFVTQNVPRKYKSYLDVRVDQDKAIVEGLVDILSTRYSFAMKDFLASRISVTDNDDREVFALTANHNFADYANLYFDFHIEHGKKIIRAKASRKQSASWAKYSLETFNVLLKEETVKLTTEVRQRAIAAHLDLKSLTWGDHEYASLIQAEQGDWQVLFSRNQMPLFDFKLVDLVDRDREVSLAFRYCNELHAYNLRHNRGLPFALALSAKRADKVYVDLRTNLMRDHDGAMKAKIDLSYDYFAPHAVEITGVLNPNKYLANVHARHLKEAALQREYKLEVELPFVSKLMHFHVLFLTEDNAYNVTMHAGAHSLFVDFNITRIPWKRFSFYCTHEYREDTNENVVVVRAQRGEGEDKFRLDSEFSYGFDDAEFQFNWALDGFDRRYLDTPSEAIVKLKYVYYKGFALDLNCVQSGTKAKILSNSWRAEIDGKKGSFEMRLAKHQTDRFGPPSEAKYGLRYDVRDTSNISVEYVGKSDMLFIDDNTVAKLVYRVQPDNLELDLSLAYKEGEPEGRLWQISAKRDTLSDAKKVNLILAFYTTIVDVLLTTAVDNTKSGLTMSLCHSGKDCVSVGADFERQERSASLIVHRNTTATYMKIFEGIALVQNSGIDVKALLFAPSESLEGPATAIADLTLKLDLESGEYRIRVNTAKYGTLSGHVLRVAASDEMDLEYQFDQKKRYGMSVRIGHVPSVRSDGFSVTLHAPGTNVKLNCLYNEDLWTSDVYFKHSDEVFELFGKRSIVKDAYRVDLKTPYPEYAHVSLNAVRKYNEDRKLYVEVDVMKSNAVSKLLEDWHKFALQLDPSSSEGSIVLSAKEEDISVRFSTSSENMYLNISSPYALFKNVNIRSAYASVDSKYTLIVRGFWNEHPVEFNGLYVENPSAELAVKWNTNLFGKVIMNVDFRKVYKTLHPVTTFSFSTPHSSLQVELNLTRDTYHGYVVADVVGFNGTVTSSLNFRTYKQLVFDMQGVMRETGEAVSALINVDLLKAGEVVIGKKTLLKYNIEENTFSARTPFWSVDFFYDIRNKMCRFSLDKDSLVTLELDLRYPVILNYTTTSAQSDTKLYSLYYTKEYVQIEIVDDGEHTFELNVTSSERSRKYEFVQKSNGKPGYHVLFGISENEGKYHFESFTKIGYISADKLVMVFAGTYENSDERFELLVNVNEDKRGLDALTKYFHVRVDKLQGELLLDLHDTLHVNANFANFREPKIVFLTRRIMTFVFYGQAYDLSLNVSSHARGRYAEFSVKKSDYYQSTFDKFSTGLSLLNGTNSFELRYYCRDESTAFVDALLQCKLHDGKYNAYVKVNELQSHIFVRPQLENFVLYSFLLTQSRLPDIVISFAVGNDEPGPPKHFGRYLSAEGLENYVFLRTSIRPDVEVLFRSSFTPFVQYLSVFERFTSTEVSWAATVESYRFGHFESRALLKRTPENWDTQVEIVAPQLNAKVHVAFPQKITGNIDSKFIFVYQNRTSGVYFVKNHDSNLINLDLGLLWLGKGAKLKAMSPKDPAIAFVLDFESQVTGYLKRVYLSYDFARVAEDAYDIVLQVNSKELTLRSKRSSYATANYVDKEVPDNNYKAVFNYALADTDEKRLAFLVSNPKFLRDVGFELKLFCRDFTNVAFEGKVTNYATQKFSPKFEYGYATFLHSYDSEKEKYFSNVTLDINLLHLHTIVSVNNFSDGSKMLLEFAKNEKVYQLEQLIIANRDYHYHLSIKTPHEQLNNLRLNASLSLPTDSTEIRSHFVLNSVPYLELVSVFSDQVTAVEIKNAFCKSVLLRYLISRDGNLEIVANLYGDAGKPLGAHFTFSFLTVSAGLSLPDHAYSLDAGLTRIGPDYRTCQGRVKFVYNKIPFGITATSRGDSYDRVTSPTVVTLLVEMPWRTMEYTQSINVTLPSNAIPTTRIDGKATLKWDLHRNNAKQILMYVTLRDKHADLKLSGYGLKDDIVLATSVENGFHLETFYAASESDKFLLDIAYANLDAYVERKFVIKYLPSKIDHAFYLVLNASDLAFNATAQVTYFNFKNDLFERVKGHACVEYGTLEFAGSLETPRHMFRVRTTNFFVEGLSNGYEIQTQLNEKEPLTVGYKFSTKPGELSGTAGAGYGDKIFTATFVPSPREITAMLTHELYGEIFEDALFSMRLNTSKLLWTKLQWTYGLPTKFQRAVLNELDDTVYILESIMQDLLEVVENDAGKQLMKDLHVIYVQSKDFLHREAVIYNQNYNTFKTTLTKWYNSNSLYVKQTVEYLVDLYPIKVAIEVIREYLDIVYEALTIDFQPAFEFMSKWFDDIISTLRNKGSTVSVRSVKEEAKKHLQNVVDKTKKTLADGKDSLIKALNDLDEAVTESKQRYLQAMQPTLSMLDDVVIHLEQQLAIVHTKVLEFLDTVQMYAMELQETKEMLKVYASYLSWLEELHMTDFLEPLGDAVEAILATVTNDFKKVAEDWKPYLDVLLEAIFGNYEGLNELPVLVELRQNLNKLSQRTVWIWNYHNVTENLKACALNAYENVDSMLGRALNMASLFLAEDAQDLSEYPYGYQGYNNNYVFRPDLGLVEVQQVLPVDWDGFNEIPKYHEHPLYRTVARHKRELEYELDNFNTLDFFYNNVVFPAKPIEPAIREVAMLFDSTHLFTVDGKYREVTRPCSYNLITTHSLEDRFSMIASYETVGDRVEIRALTIATELFRFELLRNGTVLAGGVSKDLPISAGSVSITRDANNLYVSKGRDLRVKCSLHHNQCIFEVAEIVSGLLGAEGNVEASDERCGVPPVTLVATSATYALCEDLFAKNNEYVAKCFDFVDPSPFYAMCNAALRRSGTGALCPVAIAYKRLCESRHKIATQLPDLCTQCKNSQGNNMPDLRQNEITHLFKKPKATDKSTDVIFIVNTDCYDEYSLQSTAYSLDSAFAKNANDSVNRYAAIGYSTRRNVPPAIYTSGDSIWKSANEFGDILTRHRGGSLGNRNPNLILKDAFELALTLNFRHEVPKMFVWVECNGYDSDPDTYFDVINEIVNRDVKFHSVSSDACAKEALCSVIPRATNGTSTVGYDNVDEDWAKSVADSYQTSSCHSCRCTLAQGDVPQVECTTCMSPIVKYLMKQFESSPMEFNH